MKRLSIRLNLMLSLAAISILVLTGLPAQRAAAFGGCEEDCAKCHTLKKDEAENILKSLNPNLKVLEVRDAPARGLWEVTLKANGKKGIAYLDYSKENLIIGQILKVKTRENLTKERYIELNRVDFSAIPLENAIVIGEPKALHRVVVFDDPDCPYCAKLHGILKEIVAERNDIAFFIKLFPLKIHKDAYRKAKAIQCKKSLKLLDDAFSKKKIPDPACDTDEIDRNLELGRKLGITGTPTIVLEDGRVISGALTKEKILEYIDGRTPSTSPEKKAPGK